MNSWTLKFHFGNGFGTGLLRRAIFKITSSVIIENWKASDPICSQYAWYNILMNFAVARAKELGLTKSIRRPQKKICPLCNNEFIGYLYPCRLLLYWASIDLISVLRVSARLSL